MSYTVTDAGKFIGTGKYSPYSAVTLKGQGYSSTRHGLKFSGQ